jgi:hypothetical protein
VLKNEPKNNIWTAIIDSDPLFIAPQVARSDLIKQALPFVLYFIPGVWITVLIKNISIPV